MQIVRGLMLFGESVRMDEKRFVDCSFIDCTMEYAGGPVMMENTSLRGCRYVFSGTAKMTLEFLECVGLWAVGSQAVLPETAPVVH